MIIRHRVLAAVSALILTAAVLSSFGTAPAQAALTSPTTATAGSTSSFGRLAVSPNGQHVWASDARSGSLQFLQVGTPDGSNPTLNPRPFTTNYGSYSSDIAFLPSSDHALITDNTASKVHLVSTETNAPVASLGLQSADRVVVGVVNGVLRAYVSDGQGAVWTFPVSTDPSAFANAMPAKVTLSNALNPSTAELELTPDGTRLFITSPGEAAIWAVDTATNSQISDGGYMISTSGSVDALVVSPDGRYLYASIDTTSFRFIYRLSTDNGILRITGATSIAPVRANPNMRVYRWTQLALSRDGFRLYASALASPSSVILEFATSAFSTERALQAIGHYSAPGDDAYWSIATNGTGAQAVAYAGLNTTATVAQFQRFAAPAPTPPSAPLTLTATPGNQQIELSFSAPADPGGETISGYQYSLDGMSWRTLVTSGSAPLTGTITGLTNGATYTVQVRAINSVGEGATASVMNVEPTAEVPTAPILTSVTAGQNQVVVTWKAPTSDGGSPITRYTAGAVGATTETCSSTTRTCTISGLMAAQTYTVSVRATNGVGQSPPSATQTVVPLAGPPEPPGSVQVSAQDTALDVSWTPPLNDGGSTVSRYQVSTVPASDGCTTTTQTACRITGLLNGTPYTVSVTAANGVGTGAPATAAPVAPAAPLPTRPTIRTAQTVTLTAPTSLDLSAGTRQLSAVATSGGALTWSATPATVCSVDPQGVLRVVTTGVCSVRVRQAGDTRYLPVARSATITIVTAAPPPLPAGAQRVAGADRVRTSAEIARSIFPDPVGDDRSTSVVLAGAEQFADSIAGARLAAQNGSPLLLTGRGELDAQIADEIRRLVRPGGTIFLLGQKNALSATIHDALLTLSTDYVVERLGEADRYATAVAIADELTATAGDTGPIYVVTGTDPADGASVTALAQRTGGVVVLSAGATLPDVTLDYLDDHDPDGSRAVAIGGAAAAALRTAGREAAADRGLSGADRYATSALIATRLTATSTATAPDGAVATVGIASGTAWSDSLTGAAAMARLDGPLLLTRPGELPGPTIDVLEVLEALETSVIFGGTDAVGRSVVGAMAEFLKS